MVYKFRFLMCYVASRARFAISSTRPADSENDYNISENYYTQGKYLTVHGGRTARTDDLVDTTEYSDIKLWFVYGVPSGN